MNWGGIKYEAEFKPKWMESPGIVDSWLDPLLGKVQNKLSNWRYGPGGRAAGGDVVSNFLTNIGSYVKAGASVAVETQNNTAKVAVGDGVTIDAGKENDISIDANVDMDGLNIVAEGVGNNQEAAQQTKAMVAVGVTGSNTENTALVSIGKDAKLIGKGVSVIADANLYYNPILDALDNVGKSWAKVWEIAKKTGKDLSSIKEIGDKLDELKNIDDPTEFTGKLTEIKEMGSDRMDAFLDSIKDTGAIYTQIKNAWKDSLGLLDPATYTNYYARAEVANTKQGGQSSKLDVAGAINIGILKNKAVVSMAEGATVEADGDANLHAGTKTQTVAITGSGGKYLQSNESGKSGVGVSLAIQNISADSLVLMGKDTAISSKNVTIESDNLMKQWGIVYGAGEAGTVGFTGTINVMNGGSNSVVSIDDEAELSASEKVDIKAKNDSTILAVAGGASLGNDSSYASIGFGLDVVNYDVNTVAIVADNAKDGKTGSEWLTEDERAVAKTEAEAYREEYRDSITTKVDQDIKDGVIEFSDRESEITRRLDVIYDARLEELEEEALAIKTAGDKELEVNVKRAKAVNVAREMAKEVATRTYDGTEAEAKSSMVDLTASLGDATQAGQQGTIKAKTLNVTADTDGTINSFAIEGSYSASEHDWYDKYNKFTKRSKVSSFMSDFLPNAISIPFDYLNKKIGGKIKNKLNPNAANNVANNAAGGGNQAGGGMAANVDLHIAGAGSLAINVGDGQTMAMVDNTVIKAPEEGKLDAVNIKAEDSLFSGAWAGGAAINAHTSAAAGGSREYTAGIALGYNSVDRNVDAIISNSAVKEAASISNEAKKKGAEVGLGVGLAVSKGQQGGTDASVGASVSYSRASSDIHALMVNDAVTGDQTKLSNTAYNQDIQVAGGVDFAWTSGGDDGGAFGGTATVSRIKDSLQSGIYGGTYTGMDNVTVEAVKSSLQVNAAVAGAVGTEDTAKNASFAIAYGQVDNDAEAFIKKASITSAGTVRVEANDTANESSYQEYLKQRGVDPEGTSYLGEKGQEVVGDKKGGSKVINVAIGFNKSGTAGGSVAGSINDLSETMKAEVSDSSITANEFIGQADSKTTIVSIAAGVSAGGDKFNGAGSFSWNDLTTENTATFTNSTVHAGKVSAIANNQANIVNIAGEVGFGKGVAAGLAFAYNSLDSTTGSLVKGGAYQAKDSAGTLSVAVDAQNKSDITAVTFGGSISTESSAWNGTLAINMGNNDTEAAIETIKEKDPETGKETEKGAKLDDVSAIKVNATDSSTRRTGAGELTWSKNGVAAVGAAVAYSEIGSTSAASGKENEILRAEIKGADITTKKAGDKNPDITVNASDTSTLTTAGVGLGIGMGNSNKFNAQGAAAAGVIAKKTSAAITDSRIDADSDGHQTGSGVAEVNVKSTADNYIGSGGVAVAGSFGQTVVTAGVGLAINKIGNATTAKVSGAKMNVNELLVKSDAVSQDVGVAAGFAGSAGDVALAGSFSYNYINSSATAEIKDSTINSKGNIGIVSKSDELIDNYAGALEGAKTAAIGASVAINKISGDTVANVSGSSLTAKGATGKTVALDSTVNDDDIIAHQASKETFDASRLKNARQKTEKTGVVVDSSATHAIASDLVSGGGAGKVAVELTFNENLITGKTEAAITQSNINKDAVKTVGSDSSVPDVGAKQDVTVAASDYTNIGAFEVGIAGSGNVSVGATQNANYAKRTVTAKLEGKDSASKVKVNAHDLGVTAVSKQGFSNLGLAGAGSGQGFSAAANVLTDKIDTTTQAFVKYADIGITDKASVKADNLSRAYIGTYDVGFTAEGAAVGVGVGVISQTSKVFADVSDAVISDHQTAVSSDDDTQIDIGAFNTVDTGSYFASVSIAGYGGSLSGTFTFNNFDSTVGTTVDHATLKADTVEVGAKEDLYAENYGANIAGSAFASIGLNSTVDTVTDKVYAKVVDSQLTATKQLTVGTEARRDLRQTVANLAGALGVVGVNVQETYVNKAISDDDVKNKIEEANKNDTDMTGYFVGLDDKEKATVREETKLAANAGNTPSEQAGVHTLVSRSMLTSAEDAGAVHIDATERNRINSQAGGGGAGLVAVVTTVSGEHVHYKTDVQLEDSTVAGKAVKVTSFVGDNKKHVDGYAEAMAAGKTEEEVSDSNPGLYALTGVGNIGGVNIIPAIAKVDTAGSSGITLKNSTITGKTIDVMAGDASSKTAKVTAVTDALVGISVAHATVDDQSVMAVDLDYSKDKKTIKASERLTVDAQKQDTVKAASYGVGISAVGFDGSWAFAEDHSTVGVTAKGDKLTVDAPTAVFSANNAPSLSYAVDNHGGTILGGFFSKGRAFAESTAVVDVAAGNHFNVDKLSFRSLIGEQDRTMASGELWSVSVAGVNFTPDISETKTTTISKVMVGGQTYKVDDHGNALTDLTVSADNQIEHANWAKMMDLSVLDFAHFKANGALQSESTSKDTVQTVVGGGQVKSASVTAGGNVSIDNYASGNGGALVGLGVASRAVNSFDNSATVTVGGGWKAGGFKATAMQRDELESEAYSGHGGGVDVTWVEAENTMKGKSLVQVADNTKMTADTVDMKAENQVYTNQSDKYGNRVHGVVGAIAAGTVETSDDTVTKTAEIDIGENAQVLTAGQQRYEADTVSGMNNTVLAFAAGLFEGGTARAYTNHTYSNLINVGKGAVLKNTGAYEDGGITLSAHENLKERVDADVHVDGVIGVAPNSKAINTTTRNDKITVNGTIDSAHDINFYVGADTNGAASYLRHETISETYNESVIPIAWSTNPQATLNSNNQVVISGTGIGKAVRNINVIADSGQEDGYIESRSSNLYTSTKSDKKMLTAAEGTSEYTRKADNYVKVEGALRAGVKSKVAVTIEGLAVPEGTSIDGDVAGYTGDGNYTISVNDADDKGFTATFHSNGTIDEASIKVDDGHESMKDLGLQVKTGTMDYANVLAARWKKLNELLEAYEGKDLNDDNQLTAYVGYLQEKQLIESQMEELGLMTTVTDDKGNTYKMPVLEGYKVVYVEMPDELVASGGNITVSSDNLYGSGVMKANGKPSIIVDNTSNAYLKLNQMTIGDDGGGIVFREVVLDDDTGRQEINKLNKNSSYQATFSTFETGGNAGDGGITVTNDNRFKTDISIKQEEKKEDGTTETHEGTYTPLSTVEVAGVIQGSKSKVEIDNKSGSIIIDSGTTEKPVSINGKEIVLTADGDISQGYTDGMVNIGYTPEAVLSDLEKSTKITTETYSAPNVNKNETRTQSSGMVNTILHNAETGGRIAGGSVYLSASAININGLIQSGFGNYSAEITQAQVDAAVKASQSHTGGVIVNGRQMYKVNDGGMKKGNDGIYAYVVQIYYDPSTNGLVAEDIDTKGGKVYLAGRILSTGQGKIVAMDGGADITIKNTSSSALEMGKVLNNNIDGVIQITDTLKNTRTTYKKESTETITDYKAWLGAAAADKPQYVQTAGAADAYTPKENARYNWSDGTQTTTKTTYQTDKTKFLSIIKTDEETISNEEKNSSNIKDSQTYNGDPLPEGAYLSVGKADDAAYILVADNQVLDESRSNVDSWTEWHFLNKHYYSRWTKTTGTAQTYANSLIADKPITIGFLGKTDGAIAISSVKDVALGSNIRNNSVGATLNISVSDGGISQQAGTTIFGNHADLTAKGAITNINIDGLDEAKAVKLNAISQEGDITANVTGSVAVKNLAAGVGDVLAADTYGSQNAVLTATGDIVQAAGDDAYGVKGLRIDLTSTQGAVGTADGALKVQVSQHAEGDNPLSASINVRAAKGTSLQQDTGDMRVGTITVADGDVSLTASKGTFIDATPYQGSVNNANTDTLIQRWIDVGLIAGEGAYTRQLAQDVDDYKAEIQQAYAGYIDMKAWFDKNPDAPEDPSSVAYQEYQQRKALYDKQTAKFGGYSDVDAYLASDGTYATLIEKRDHPTYKWTKEQMLYAVRKSIVNKETGSTDQEKKPANIYGKNITLKGMGVGIDKDTTQEITIEMLDSGYKDPDTGKTYIDYLKMLANADAADVDVEYVKDASGNIVKQQVPVYQTDETGRVVLDDDNNPVIDHYKDGDPVIAKFIIGGKAPLGIYATGTVNAESTGTDASHEGDVFIASRNKNETEQALALNVGQVTVADKTASDVRLYGKAGVYNALDNVIDGDGSNYNTANVIARDLIVEGGTGFIGMMDDKAKVKDFTVDLAGNLTARAEGSIYIRNVNEDKLQLASVYSADTVALTSGNGIVMGDVNDDIGYINAKKGLSLTVNPDTGVIGTDEKALRILNTGVVIEIEAGSANIHGVTGGESDTMKLGVIKTKDTFTASSEDSLDLLGSYEKTVIETDGEGNPVIDEETQKYKTKTITVNGSLTSGGDVILSAVDNLTLDAVSKVGMVDENGYVTDGKKLTLIAEKGSFTQTDYGAITAGAVKTVSGKMIELTNDGNHFSSYTASGIMQEGAVKPVDIDGSVTVKTHGGKTLEVAFDTTVNGDVAITNLDEDGGLLLKTDITAQESDIAEGKVSLTSDGDMTTSSGKRIQSASDTNLTSVSGNVTLDGGIQTGKDLNVTAGKSIAINGKQEVTENLNMTAKDAVLEGAEGSVLAETVNASIGKGIDLQNGNNQFAAFTAQGLEQEGGAVADIDGNVFVKAKGTLNGTPDLKVTVGSVVNGNVSATNLADDGHLVLTSSITAKKTDDASGEIYLESDADMTTSSDTSLVSDGKTTLVSRSGSVNLEGGVTTGTDLIAEAAKDVMVDVALVVPHTLKATAGNSVYETGTGSINAAEVWTLTGGSVDLQNANNAFNKFTASGIVLEGQSLAETINGDILVKTQTDALDAEVSAAINGDMEITNLHDDGKLNLHGETVVNGSEERNKEGHVILSAKGDISTDNSITADADIRLESTEGNITVGADTGDVTHSKDGSVIAQTGNGNITIRGDIDADAGNVAATVSGDGSILFDGYVDAGHDVTASVEGAGGITFKSDVDAVRNVEAKTASGDIVFSGNQTRGNEITVEANEGNINVYGKVVSDAGGITFKAVDENPAETDKGNITFHEGSTLTSLFSTVDLHTVNGDITVVGAGESLGAGSIVAEGDITVATEGTGDIAINGKLESKTGSLSLTAENGDILTNGDVDAGKNIYATVFNDYEANTPHGIFINGTVDAGDVVFLGIGDAQARARGNISVLGTVNAGMETGDEDGGSVKALILGEGDITFAGDIDAKTDVLVGITGAGNIRVEDGDVYAHEGDVEAVILGEGDISFERNVKAGADVSASVDGKGDITVKEDVIAGGNVEMTATKGNITVEDDISAGDSVTINIAEKGNISIGDETSVVGEDKVAIGAANDITLKTGEGVIKVYGETTAEKGDISMTAASSAYTPGEDGMNIIIDSNSRVTSGQDINLTATNGDIHVTDAVTAARDLNAKTVTQGSVYFDTDLVVGQDIKAVTEKGDVKVGEDIQAGRDISIQITQEGSVDVGRTVHSTGGSVDITTANGNIKIGDTGENSDTVYAKDNINLSTELGQIEIYGETATKDGDINVAAASDDYIEGQRNIIVDLNGQIDSGRSVTLDATNGDIHVTDDIIARQDLNAATHKNGTVYFDAGVDVAGKVTAKTDTGGIIIGNSVEADGDISMQVAKEGTIDIGKTVHSTGGNVDITTAKGDVRIGDNGEGTDTVYAKDSINLATGLGKIEIYGETATKDGDISVSAASDNYIEGQRNIIVDMNGEIDSGRNVTLDATNGDIHVTDDIIARQDLNSSTHTEGSVYFDNDVAVAGNVNVSTDKGDVTIGDAAVGKGNVTASGVTIAIGEGDVDIVKTVTATKGDIDIATGQGDILIGDNGPKEDTVTAKGNIDLVTRLGKVEINGRTATDEGDISIAAASDGYIEGQQNIVLAANGEIDSGRNVTLDATNGDIHVTDDIIAKQNLNVATHKEGTVYFDESIKVAGDVNATTDKGEINIGQTVEAGNDINLKTVEGSITVAGAVEAGGGVEVSAGKGDISLAGDVTGAGITAKTGEGDVTVGGDTVSRESGISFATDEGSVTVSGSLDSAADISLASANGDIETLGGVTAKGNVTAVSSETGGIRIGSAVDAGGDVSAITDKGGITVEDTVTAQGDVSASAGEGDIALNGDVTGSGITAQTGAGDIVLAKTVKATEGNVDVTTSKGNISVGGSVEAQDSVNLAAHQGTVQIKGGVKTAEGDVSVSAASDSYSEGQQNIIIGGEIDSGRDVALDSTNGDIHVTSAIRAKEDLAAITHKQGDVYLDADLTVARNLSVATDKGNITVKDSIGTGNDITFTINEKGDVNADDVTADHDVIVKNNGTGNVTIDNIVADNLADVETTNGDMNIDTITGNRVIALGGNNTQASHIGTVTANANGNANGTGEPDVVLGGNYVNVDTVRKADGSSPLTLATQGATADQPMRDFNISSLNSDTGTVIQDIWTVNGNIHVDEGNLHISKAYAIDKLRVDNGKVSVALFGATPRREGEDIVLWNDLRKNQPGNNLDAWYNGSYSSRHWVNMDLLTNGRVNADNGVVIDYHNYPYFHGDHNSVVNAMGRYLTGRMYEDWYDISYFDRYGLVQSADGFEQNATFDEIKVE